MNAAVMNAATEPADTTVPVLRADGLNVDIRLQHSVVHAVQGVSLATSLKFVESGPPEELFRSPAHHYTRALIGAAPNPVPGRAAAVTISGEFPSAAAPPSGCRFPTRCPAAQDLCAGEEPVMRAFGPGQQAACHFPLKEAVLA